VLFATGLLSFSLFQLLLRGFYAMQDTRTPALINLGATAVGTAVNFIYFRYLGVKGLALGQTTAYTIATIAALLVMRARLGSIDGRRLTGSSSVDSPEPCSIRRTAASPPAGPWFVSI
jgi:putative peptidoglycan lipid II flippase